MHQPQRGLDYAFNNSGQGGGGQYITFEEGKPITGIFLDWGDDVLVLREHYEKTLNPHYIGCPGKEVCPLCRVTNKIAPMKIKARFLDAADWKVKFVSLAPTHAKSLKADFEIEKIDPTREFVTIYRSGKTANDTKYSARRSQQQWQIDLNTIEKPNLEDQAKVYTAEEISQIMAAVTNAVPQPGYAPQPPAPAYGAQPGYIAQPGYGGQAPMPQYGAQPGFPPAPMAPQPQAPYAPMPQTQMAPPPMAPPQAQAPMQQPPMAPGVPPVDPYANQQPVVDPFANAGAVPPAGPPVGDPQAMPQQQAQPGEPQQYVPTPPRQMPF